MRRALLIVCFIGAAGCAKEKEVDLAAFSGRSDRLVWDAGQQALKKKDWLTAREHFRRIVDGFPNSEYAAQARIALGDTYFREGGTANLILAISEYRQFLTLFPSHAQSDYAQFQVGEAFFKQRNGPDRDQTPTKDALIEYERLLQQFPGSTHAEKSKGRVAECRHSLAKAEYMVGVFYERSRQTCRAAIPRYQGVLSDYPDYPQLDEVLFHLAQCLVGSGRHAEAAPHLQRLVENYPSSRFVLEAKRLQAAEPSPQVKPQTMR